MRTVTMWSGHHRAPAGRPVRAHARQALLACGALAALLHAFTDLLGGLRSPGYSFASQASSELMAAGAPSETLVDPLFVGFGLLAAAFGLGLILEAARRSVGLRIAGLLLVAYGALGASAPGLFEMQPRGVGTLRTEFPHILVAGVLSLLAVLIIGSAAMALDRRFRRYSIVTILVMIAAGGMRLPYATDLAAGLATPGLGIFDRIDFYSFLLWIAVLAVMLLRDQPAASWSRPAHA